MRTPSGEVQSIGLDNGSSTATQFRYRVVGYCRRFQSPHSLSPGNLNYSPVGLGMLLTAGYVGDARVFYCPSAKDMKTGFTCGAQTGPSALRDWKSAGGFDGATLHFGDWNANRLWTGSPGTAVFSSYGYRNVPLGMLWSWHRYLERKRSPALKVPGVRGDAYAQVGGPFFCTQRKLGNRAIVTDTFDKGSSFDGLGRIRRDLGMDVADSCKAAGFGIQAHRVAYNTLYGDGHAAPLGDPQERILWHAESEDATTSCFYTAAGDPRSYSNLGTNFWSGSWGDENRQPFGHPIDHEAVKNTSIAVWHEFDVAGGMDVDAQ